MLVASTSCSLLPTARPAPGEWAARVSCNTYTVHPAAFHDDSDVTRIARRRASALLLRGISTLKRATNLMAGHGRRVVCASAHTLAQALVVVGLALSSLFCPLCLYSGRVVIVSACALLLHALPLYHPTSCPSFIQIAGTLRGLHAAITPQTKIHPHSCQGSDACNGNTLLDQGKHSATASRHRPVHSSWKSAPAANCTVGVTAATHTKVTCHV